MREGGGGGARGRDREGWERASVSEGGLMRKKKKREWARLTCIHTNDIR